MGRVFTYGSYMGPAEFSPLFQDLAFAGPVEFLKARDLLGLLMAKAMS